MRDQVVDNIIDKYYERSQVGITKYGTTLYNNNHDNYLKHLQEELMDATLYLQKLIDLKQELTIMVKMYGNDADLGAAVRNLVK
jgi:ankyrin repeat protein